MLQNVINLNLINFINKLALEISEESEPMEIDDIVESLSENELEHNEIENLDELINNLAYSNIIELPLIFQKKSKVKIKKIISNKKNKKDQKQS